MTAVLCRDAPDRTADTWAEQLAPFERLEFAVSDAATGLAGDATRPGRVTAGNVCGMASVKPSRTLYSQRPPPGNFTWAA